MSAPRRRAGRPHLRLVGGLPASSPPAPVAPVGPAVPAAPAPDPLPLAAGELADPGLTERDPAGLARELARDLDMIDRVLSVQPVPQPILTWRAATTGTFELPWRELAGTLHQEPSYLAVALVHYPALDAAEAVVHLRVPAGTPGVYLNPFDHGDRLPAPTLLLGRGLLLFVHETRRERGQWHLRAELLPPPPPGWPDHEEGAGGARRGQGRHLTLREGDDHGR